MIYRPARSSSRLSQTSKIGSSRVLDEDARTSVKVVVRVRPPLGPSDPGYDLIPQRFQRSTVQVNTATTLAVDSPQGRKLFIFDRVFGQDGTQDDLWDYLQDSVESFVQGYNVSILAYGQSGAGKSYTMGTAGPEADLKPAQIGVIPRAAQHLFDLLDVNTPTSRPISMIQSPTKFSSAAVRSYQQARSLKEKGWEMSVTYLEIYNEQPRDLLLPEHTPSTERATLQIREDPRGRIFAEGLKSIQISSVDELLRILSEGSKIRQTDATAINDRSSRSHAVFTISLKQSKPSGTMSPQKDQRRSMSIDGLSSIENSVVTESKLHFVDLAGSERLKNTGATGDRAKEGISINAGLASLGKVIAQLSSRSPISHISYRDSKLTRLLQDSLGGNAITYMIACVTPTEFHLSETLNTVQYAQRARNIQTKPQIQRISDEDEKAATIEHLRNEIAFLRQQLRINEGEDCRNGDGERSERLHEREVELQNQLLDLQESYTTLGKRHAKLVSDLATNAEKQESQLSITESPVYRLKRSQAHQEQIEQVVLEYETTIQSLEANLATTRASLAITEGNLLERESKYSFADTVNQQLNARVQKLMDREIHTETYVRDLETQFANQTSGDEKNSAIITELRKEIARIRQSETNAEDYISTLEERLAEADSDLETVQREVDRLENLVQRQRSIGKLDSLIYELDHIQKSDNSADSISLTTPKPNGVRNYGSESEDTGDQTTLLEETPESSLSRENLKNGFIKTPSKLETGLSKTSPEQLTFVADKFESVSQELFELRIEHESTVNELDLLSAKYQEALRTLAEMHETPGQTREDSTPSPDSEVAPRPVSFLAGPKIQGLTRAGHLPSSRSVSSEFSSVGESPISMDTDVAAVSGENPSVKFASHEVNRLQSLLQKHEQNMGAMVAKYSQLEADHKDTLSTVDRLKAEVQRSRTSSPGPNAGMFRRMTSQLTGVDRGQKSIVALRNLLSEDYEDHPDRMDSFEQHLSTANYELQTRMERIQALESEMKTAKKELDLKATMISGLTRERNSTKAGSAVDLGMVSQLRDQLIQKETELKTLHETYARREQELQNEIESIGSRSQMASPVIRTSTNPFEVESKLKSSQDDHSSLSENHQAVQRNADESKSQLASVRAELAAALAALEALKLGQLNSAPGTSEQREIADKTQTQSVHDDLVRDLYAERATSEKHIARIAELEKSLATSDGITSAKSELARVLEQEVDELKKKVASLETQLSQANSDVEFHKHGLRTLHEAHDRALTDLKQSHTATVASYATEIVNQTSAHAAEISRLKSEHDQRTGDFRSEHNTHLEALKAQHDAILIQQKDEQENYFAALKSQHDGKFTDLNNSHAGVVADLQKRLTDFETQRAGIVSDHEKKVADIQAFNATIIGGREKDLSDLRNAHDVAIAHFEKEVADLKATLAVITTDHEKMISSLKASQVQTNEEHQKAISNLKESHAAASARREEEITTLQASHAMTLDHQKREISDMKNVTAQEEDISNLKATHAEALAAYDSQVSEMKKQLDYKDEFLNEELQHVKSTIYNLIQEAQAIFGHSTTTDMLVNHIQDLADEKRHVSEANQRLTRTNADLEQQLADRQGLSELEAQLAETTLKMQNYQETIRSLANEVGKREEAIREKDTIIEKHQSLIHDVEGKAQKKMQLIEELEQQLATFFDHPHGRNSAIQSHGSQTLIDLPQRVVSPENDVDPRQSVTASEMGSMGTATTKSQLHTSTSTIPLNPSYLRKSNSIASLPSPPPAIPLPPLPTLPTPLASNINNPSPPQSRHTSKEAPRPLSPASQAARDAAVQTIRHQTAQIEEQETRLRTMEKHLQTEKQLTSSLEEALVDLETQSNKLRADADSWRKKTWIMEEELMGLRHERKSDRLSVQVVEEEVKKRREAEAAKAQLEERMRLLTISQEGGKKKRKGGGLNCF